MGYDNGLWVMLLCMYDGGYDGAGYGAVCMVWLSTVSQMGVMQRVRSGYVSGYGLMGQQIWECTGGYGGAFMGQCHVMGYQR